MKCPKCAEEIQDTAVLCRFCGARRGSFTFRTAGVLFVLSAVFELFSVTSAVPLAGEMRGGAVAAGYHCVFVFVFLIMGIGLWRRKSWGYRVTLAGTAIYLLDRIVYLLDNAARSASIEALTGDYRELFDATLMDSIGQSIVAVTLVTILCWLGFAAYTHRHRDYFTVSCPPSEP